MRHHIKRRNNIVGSVGRFAFPVKRHPNYHIGPHLSSYVSREVVRHTSINQHHAISMDRAEHTRDRHTRADAGRKVATVHIHFLTRNNIDRHTGKRHFQIGKIHTVGAIRCQRLKQVQDGLTTQHAALQMSFAVTESRYSDHILFGILAGDKVLLATVRLVQQQVGPVLATVKAVELVGRVTIGIQATNNRAHTGTYNIVDRHTKRLDDLQHADVCGTFGTTPTQHHANLQAFRRRSRLNDITRIWNWKQRVNRHRIGYLCRYRANRNCHQQKSRQRKSLNW